MDRDDWRAAHQTAHLLNAWKGRKGDPVRPEDVVLDFDVFEDEELEEDARKEPSLRDLRLAARMCR